MGAPIGVYFHNHSGAAEVTRVFPLSKWETIRQGVQEQGAGRLLRVQSTDSVSSGPNNPLPSLTPKHTPTPPANQIQEADGLPLPHHLSPGRLSGIHTGTNSDS